MSEIRATTISDAAGTGPITLTGQSAAKAWVNFNGTGTVAVRDSENVSSITDNGTGSYRVNWTNAFGAADYAVSGTSNDGYIMGPYTTTGAITASNVSVLTWYSSFADTDPNSVLAHGDLA